jgi:hypothetical protein
MSDEHIHITGRVTHDGPEHPIENATVSLYANHVPAKKHDKGPPIARTRTNANGHFEIEGEVDPNNEHTVLCEAFGECESQADQQLKVESGRRHYPATFELNLGLVVSWHRSSGPDGKTIQVPYAVVGRPVVARADSKVEGEIAHYHWHVDPPTQITGDGHSKEAVCVFERHGLATITATITDRGDARVKASSKVPVVEETRNVGVRGEIGVHVGGNVRVTMERTDSPFTPDKWLWRVIDERCESIGFGRYREYIREEFQLPGSGSFPGEFSRKLGEMGARGVGAYRTLRNYTELFVLKESNAVRDRSRRDEDDLTMREFPPQPQRSREALDEELREHYLVDNDQLPYVDRVVRAANAGIGLDGEALDQMRRRMFRRPLFLELWHDMCLEHGMLMRTMDAVCARFQNIYNRGENDGLASYEISPLWPLGDLLWDWINHEPERLNATRRAQEHQHQYGTEPDRNAFGVRVADARSTFPNAFMRLLTLCEEFYWEDSQTTVIADAFPVRIALRDVHQILAMGAGNAAPQLTFAARVETLMMQFMLAQPELRAFLHVREMVPYDEAWMGQVDAMKDLQGWQQHSISHYRDLAVYGEQIVLSIRLADWTQADEDRAKNWLRHYKNAVKRFIYAYRSISGVDLGATNDRPATRAAFGSSDRQRTLRGQSQARRELGFSETVGQLTPGVSNRVRQID